MLAASVVLCALKDPRVWAFFWVYGACFGVELIIHNMAAMYFTDTFKVDLKSAGLYAGLFGLLCIFARTLGGYVSDKANWAKGLRGRRLVLFAVPLLEGIFLLVFSQTSVLWMSVAGLMLFGLFVHMSTGATYALVPYINKEAMGSVGGIIRAGGNVGAVLGGFLFRTPSLTGQQALFILGISVVATSVLVLTVRFSEQDERDAKLEMEKFLGVGTTAAIPA